MYNRAIPIKSKKKVCHCRCVHLQLCEAALERQDVSCKYQVKHVTIICYCYCIMQASEEQRQQVVW